MYSSLLNSFSDISISASRIVNSSDTLYYRSLLTLNKNSWNGATLSSILLCSDPPIFSDNQTYTIGATIQFYRKSNNEIINNKSASINIMSNSKPNLLSDICNISPLVGQSLSTNFVLRCNNSKISANDNNDYLYNFFYDGIFITNYNDINSNTNFTTILGTGNHTIKAIIVNKHTDYRKTLFLEFEV